MLSSGFFLEKKPLGTMPETPQELETRRKIKKVERRALARAMRVTNDTLRNEANLVNLSTHNHFAL